MLFPSSQFSESPLEVSKPHREKERERFRHIYTDTYTVTYIIMGLHESESRTQIISNDGDDGYINMEVNLSSSSSPSSSFFSFSPPHSREFEFQMCSSAVASGESTTSPADELFYKGQLLPLHLPPRLQMVQKLLHASSTTATDTPISPRAAAVSSPRRFSSSEIVVSSQDEQCFFEISTENNKNHSGNSWSKKIKHSSITQKLKASRAYIKALFSKPGCSDSSEIHPKFRIETLKSSRKKNPFVNCDNSQLIHRRSFSGVIQRHSQAKCISSSSSSSSASSLSSSFSFGSNGSLDLPTLTRSSNASDNSIEGAIEHCKQSFTTRKSNVAESELSSSRTSVSTSADLEKEWDFPRKFHRSSSFALSVLIIPEKKKDTKKDTKSSKKKKNFFHWYFLISFVCLSFRSLLNLRFLFVL